MAIVVAGLSHWIPPAAFVLGGILAGLIAERAVLARIERYVARREWAGQLVLTALRGLAFTGGMTAGIYGAVLSVPLAPVWSRVLEKALLSIVIASVTVVVARIAAGSVNLYAQRLQRHERGTDLLSPTIVTNFSQLLVFLVGALIILQSLGIAISPILTALGVGGLAVALALQETLTNLFAGLYILTARQIRPGDYVRLNTGEEGKIIDITWRNAKIVEGPNNLIIVPNTKLASATVTNYNQPDREIVVAVQVGVSYDNDLVSVERTTLEVARQILQDVPGSVREFEPALRYQAFAETSVNFVVVLRVRDISEQDRIKHEFIKRLHTRYQADGIRFRSPAVGAAV
jgi:small-conductance mechanosensitive channel